jgi:hypothetical protein
MSTIVTRSGKGSPLTNTEVDANFTNLNTGKAELSGAVFTGAITTNSTIDGRDVAADGVTADAALPKAGGTLTGAITGTTATFRYNGVGDCVVLESTEAGASAAPDLKLYRNSSSPADGDDLGNVNFTGKDDAGNDTPYAFIMAEIGDASNGSEDGNLYFRTMSGGSLDNRLSIQSSTVSVSGDLDVDGTTNLDVVDIDGAVDMASTLAVGGVLTANAGVVVDNFTLDGTTLALSSGSMTLDSAAQIILDGADDGAVQLRDDGTKYADIYSTSGDFYIKSTQSDKDIKFQGNDGGLGFTALTLDMSAAGAATFNSTVTAPQLAITSASTADTVTLTRGTNGQNNMLKFVTGSTADWIVGERNDSSSDFRIFSYGANANVLSLARSTGAATFSSSVTSTAFGSQLATTSFVQNALISTVANSSGAFIRMAVSNAGNPTYAFEDDTNTGMFTSGADTLNFTTGGSERFRIAPDGSLSTPTLGTSNVRFGVNAGNSITSGGNYNVVVGDNAGTAITTGDENIAIGYNSLLTEDTGKFSVAIGVGALQTQNNDGNNYNTAVGHEAGKLVTTGIQNTLMGGLAGDALTDADSNTAVGYGALTSDTLGSASVAFGASALASQNFTSATSSYSTGVGYNAGAAVTTGVRNTLIGGLAGDALNTASNNVAVGMLALTSDTKGDHSVAIGTGALSAQNFTSATDTYNTAVGDSAGGAVTTGIYNTLIGGLAGDALTDADRNVALGYGALGACQLGSRNTAVGFYALEVANPSSAVNTQNTALGHSAGRHISTGTHNVCIGTDSGLATNLTTGSGNVVVGNFAHTSAYNSTYANGFGYDINAESGYTTLGKAADDIRAAHGNVTWATVSDQRYKKDIVDSEAGLSFINALQPRTFKYKNLNELPETFNAYDAESTEVFKNSNTNHGFIAQEVKAAIDADSSIKDGFRLWDDRDDGSQEVAEAALIPILVKAIQEQQALIESLTARIETLEG